MEKTRTNKHRLVLLALSVRREKLWHFYGILCFCNSRVRLPERNSHIATRNAVSSSHAGWPDFWVHKSQPLASAAAALFNRRLFLIVANSYLFCSGALSFLVFFWSRRKSCASFLRGFRAKTKESSDWRSPTPIPTERMPTIVPH